MVEDRQAEVLRPGHDRRGDLLLAAPGPQRKHARGTRQERLETRPHASIFYLCQSHLHAFQHYRLVLSLFDVFILI